MEHVRRIVLVVLCSFSLCQLLFIFSSHGLKTYNNHKTERLTELLKSKTYYELIFIGSSRTHEDINPRVIDSVCGISSYNAGVEGGNMVEYKMIFDAYLLNHPPPKFLVLTIDMASFNLTRKFFNHTDYYPYLSNKVVNRTLRDNGHFTALIKVFPFFEFTEYDEELRSRWVNGLFGKNEIIPGQAPYKGYMASEETINGKNDMSPGFMEKEIISPGSIELFNSIKDTCKANKVRLIINYAPEYKMELQKSVINSSEILSVIYHLAIDNNIPYLKDDHLRLCTDPDLFSDYAHLNQKGAAVYSRVLGVELSGIIKGSR